MLQAASQASAFYREVAETRVLWTIEDHVGYPAPTTSSGKRAQPFWSSKSRAERIIATATAYRVFRPTEVAWADFCARWIPDFIRDGLLIGVNWSGPRVTGCEIEPERVQEYIQSFINRAAEQATRKWPFTAIRVLFVMRMGDAPAVGGTVGTHEVGAQR